MCVYAGGCLRVHVRVLLELIRYDSALTRVCLFVGDVVFVVAGVT